MIVKLYLDEDVWVGLAEALRHGGYDVTAVSEFKRKGASDEEQLAHAAGENRAILTHNIKDFVPLAQMYADQNKPHAGMIVCNALKKGSCYDAL